MFRLCLTIGLLIAAPAMAQDPHKQAITPEGMEGVAEYGYSNAVRSGDMLYLAGVVAGAPDGASDDAEAMAVGFRRAFETIAYVLEAGGASWDDVVDMTTYHTDLPAQIDTFMAVKSDYVLAPYPAWTAIDIDRLYPDSGIAEIKVVARIPSDD